jgi:hypothetical protein
MAARAILSSSILSSYAGRANGISGGAIDRLRRFPEDQNMILP